MHRPCQVHSLLRSKANDLLLLSSFEAIPAGWHQARLCQGDMLSGLQGSFVGLLFS
jgi:hypothetical protein